jgi:hypothetical protein
VRSAEECVREPAVCLIRPRMIVSRAGRESWDGLEGGKCDSGCMKDISSRYVRICFPVRTQWGE